MTSPRVMAGYDGSVAAGAAIGAAASLLPQAHAWITHLWMPPFADHARVPPPRMWEEYLVGPGAADESEYRTRVVYPLG